jgi:hypothetical protein
MKRKRCSKQIIKILTDHRNHHSSSKTFQRLEENQITNIQHKQYLLCYMAVKPEHTKRTKQIQNHSSRDEIYDENCKIYTVTTK